MRFSYRLSFITDAVPGSSFNINATLGYAVIKSMCRMHAAWKSTCPDT